MVFDWFNRRPEAAQPAQPAPSPEDTAASPLEEELVESSVASAPSAASEGPPTESVAPFSVPAATESVPDPEPPQSSGQPSTEPANPDDDPLEWARQAYARLKAQKEQEQAQQESSASVAPPAEATTPAAPTPPQSLSAEPRSAEPVSAEQVSDQKPSVDTVPAEQPSVEPSAVEQPFVEQAPVEQPAAEPPSPGLSLLEQAAAQRQERQQQLEQAPAPEVVQPAAAVSAQPQTPVDPSDEPSLGEFDDTFTWSAEVLAAQGRSADQVTLEEIDWLGRLRQGLEKTRQGFVTGLLENLGDDPLTPEVLDDLESLLLRADAGVQATDQVLEALRRRMNEQVVDPTEGIRFLKEQLRDLLDKPIKDSGVELLAPQREQLNVWLMVGVNGVGKTTTLGKLANLAVRSGYSAMIAAADTFRAAAVQQVQVWGDRSEVPVVANPSSNADPAAVVFDAIGAARSKGTDLVLVDTAGRLQTKHNLMEELEKIRRVVDRLAPDAHVESLLVLDASQGQNGLKQAMAFAKAAGLTGVVITKLDGTARGGVALAVASEAGLPIRFIGAGEGIRDLRPFNSFEFVEALLAGR